MAQNNSRSQNKDLRKGVNDGVYKNRTPDRGGEVEDKAIVRTSSAMSGYSTDDAYPSDNTNPVLHI